MLHSFLTDESLKNDLVNIFRLEGCEFSTFMEMNEFPEQQQAFSGLDSNCRVDWIVYPTVGVGGDHSFLMIDLVQGISKRCPIFAIRLNTKDTNALYPLIKVIHEHLLVIDPTEFLINNQQINTFLGGNENGNSRNTHCP